MCEVVNQRDEHYDVYIGRGSFWGNPFVIGKDGTREEVIQRYLEDLWSRRYEEGMIEKLLELEGKTLGCFCKPLPCHGDVIIKAVRWARRRKDEQREIG